MLSATCSFLLGLSVHVLWLVFPGLVRSLFCVQLLRASLLRTWRSALIWSLFFLGFAVVHCTPSLCLLLFVLLSSAFWLYLLYFWYSCPLVLFVLLYRLGFLQFLKLMSLSCHACRQLCLRPVLVQQLNRYLTTDMLFGWLCHSWILLKSFPQRNTALLTEFSILVAETRCGL